MKKFLLLLLSTLSFLSFGQGATTCATATVISMSGTYVIGALTTGTYPTGTGLCFSDASSTPNARWYKFTPTQTGVITVTSATTTNSTNADTRLSLLTGACTGPWTCVASNDDINASNNFRSAITNVTVNSGTTYYIVWDDRYDSANYNFDFTFTPQSCFVPTGLAFTSVPTATTVGIGWVAPTTGTPTGYEFEYGIRGFTQGSGITVTTATTGVSLTGLTGSTVYDTYVRTNCGSGDFSVWRGPVTFNTPFAASNVPYSTSFEDDTFGFIGWTAPAATPTTGNWGFNPAGSANTTVQNGNVSALSFSSTTAASNASLISRGVNLVANDVASVSFFARNYVATGNTTSTATYQVRVGTAATVAAQSTVIGTETNLAAITWAQKSYTFTPTTSGVYFFSILNQSAVNSGGADHALIIDSFSVTQVLSNNQFFKDNFTIYPNPANDVVNISKNSTIEIKSVNITDMNGRVVKEIANEVESIKIAELSAGVYFLKINTAEGTATTKLVKN